MAFPQSKERGVARCRAGRGVALLGGRGVAGSACRGSGPARAGVRGHDGAVRGGKRCLKRVSNGTRGIAENPAWQGKGLGSRHVGLREVQKGR